ncbi:hypothetical protein NYE24_10850 [Paenibacillus sp. FSL H7-0350]
MKDKVKFYRYFATWLDDLAATNNVNYSRILQDALKEQLGVNERR